MSEIFSVKAINPEKLSVFEVRWELLNALAEEGRTQIAELEKTTRNWEGEKPRFWADIDVSSSDVALLVGPTGSARGVQKWVWLDEGTEPHTITAKNAPYLTFRLGYNSGTRPDTLSTRRAYYIGNHWRRKRSVRHPGTKARNWSVLIQKRRAAPFLNAMLNAMNRGLKKSGWSR